MLFEKLERMGLSQNSLAGKVAIVTGAGRGIGKELARALAWLGAKVVIAEITEDGAEVEKLIRSEGGEALFIKTDVSSKSNMQDLTERTLEVFGNVDILVNNAVAVTTGSILEQSLEDWDRIYAINLRAAVLGIKTFLPSMLEKKEGTIVLVASAEGMPFLAPYSASKAALTSLGFSLAAELGDESGVSVFVFGPGMVDTPAIREAASLIAPAYGMTYEEFTNQSVNPGYDGLMPAEDCAAGFAYNIVHAKDYHGQNTGAIPPLMKFGITPMTKESAVDNVKPTLSDDKTQKTPTKLSNDSSQVVQQTIEVKEILETVDREFEEQGFFAKKWVKRTFAQRTGLNNKDWIETADNLIFQLQNLSEWMKEGKTEELNKFKSKLPWIIAMLEKLADYFNSTIEDARGFIKDPHDLSLALEALDYREKAVHSLVSSLKKMLE